MAAGCRNSISASRPARAVQIVSLPDTVYFNAGESAAFLHPRGFRNASNLTTYYLGGPNGSRVSGNLLHVDLTGYQRPGRWAILSPEGEALTVDRFQQSPQRIHLHSDVLVAGPSHFDAVDVLR